MKNHVYLSTPFKAFLVKGEDNSSFLQNMLTQDLQKVNSNQAKFSLLSDAKGRVIGQFLIFLIEEGYLLITHQSLIQHLMEHLKRYIFRSRVLIEKSDYFIYLLQGKSLFSQASFLSVEQSGEDYQIFLCQNLEANLFLSKKERTGLVPPEHDETWKSHLMQKGFCILNEALTGKFLPHQLDAFYWDMVSLQKGCYMGQEIINRLFNLSTPDQWLGWAISKKPLEIGSSLFTPDQQLSGTVLDQAHLHTPSYCVLALLKDNAGDVVYTEQGEKLFFKRRKK